jgi:hypothetical protein
MKKTITPKMIVDEIATLANRQIELEHELESTKKAIGIRRQRYINLTCKFKPGQFWKLPEYESPVYQITRIRPQFHNQDLDAVTVWGKFVLSGFNKGRTHITESPVLHSRDAILNNYQLDRAKLLPVVDKLNGQA